MLNGIFKQESFKSLNNPLGDYLTTRNPNTLNEALHVLTNDFNAYSKTLQGFKPKPLTSNTNLNKTISQPIKPPNNQIFYPKSHLQQNVSVMKRPHPLQHPHTPLQKPTLMSISTRQSTG